MRKQNIQLLAMISLAIVYVTCPLIITRDKTISQNAEIKAKQSGEISEWVNLFQSLEQPFIQIQFMDDKNGWAISRSFLWHTENGGYNWAKISTNLKATLESHSSQANVFYRMQFLSNLEGWLVEGGRLLNTSDGGSTWNRHELPQTVMRSVYFISKRQGWAVGEALTSTTKEGDGAWQGIILATNDSGISWSKVFTSTDIRRNKTSFFDVCALNEKQIWAVGDTILQSNDGGYTWKQITVKNGFSGALSSVKFNEDGLGWMAPASGNRFLVTKDKGITWEIKEAPPDVSGVYNIVMINSDKIWIAINDILYSPDGGNTWIDQAKGHFNHVFYLSSTKTIFAAGNKLLSRNLQQN